MATETLAPDALLEQTNLSGAVTDVDEDPDSPDADWLTAGDAGSDTVARLSFPSPTGDPTTGAGVQEFRVLVRRTSNSTREPDCTVELYESGSLVTTLIAAQAISSASGVVLSGTWDASNLSTVDGSGVEVRVEGSRTGGPGNQRNTVEVGAVEWNVDYQEATEDHTGTAALSGGGSLTQAGQRASLGTTVLSGAGTIIAAGIMAASGVAQVSGGGELVVSGQADRVGSATLSGSGSLSASGDALEAHSGTASVSGGGEISSAGVRLSEGSPLTSGSGTLQATGERGSEGSAPVSGGGTLTASGESGRVGSGAISGAGTLTASGSSSEGATGAATLSGGGSVSAAGASHRAGTATLSGSGGLSASGSGPETHGGTATLSESGTLTSSGVRHALGAARLSGSGDMSAAGGTSISGVKIGPVFKAAERPRKFMASSCQRSSISEPKQRIVYAEDR